MKLFSVLVGPISRKKRSGDDLLNALVQDGERVERLDCVVRVQNAEVEDVAQQGQSRKDFTELERLFVGKQEHKRADYDASVVVDCTAALFDVAVSGEEFKLLTSSLVYPVRVNWLQQPALDCLDSLEHLGKQLNPLVRPGQCLVLGFGDDLVSATLH